MQLFMKLIIEGRKGWGEGLEGRGWKRGETKKGEEVFFFFFLKSRIVVYKLKMEGWPPHPPLIVSSVFLFHSISDPWPSSLFRNIYFIFLLFSFFTFPHQCWSSSFSLSLSLSGVPVTMVTAVIRINHPEYSVPLHLYSENTRTHTHTCVSDWHDTVLMADCSWLHNCNIFSVSSRPHNTHTHPL